MFGFVVLVSVVVGAGPVVAASRISTFPPLKSPPFTFASLGFCGGASASRGRVRSACAQLSKGGAFLCRIDIVVMFGFVVLVSVVVGAGPVVAASRISTFPPLKSPPFTFASLGFCGGASASRGRVRSACAQLSKGRGFSVPCVGCYAVLCSNFVVRFFVNT